MTYKDPDKQREAKCSNCGKEVPQTEGKRPKLYCDDACRMKAKRRASHKIKPSLPNINNERIITEHSITNKSERTATSDSNIGQGKPKRGKDVAILEKSRQTGMTASVSAHIDKVLHDAGDITLATGIPDERLQPKRGKDIKCFADLPADVQETIDNLSMVDGKICQRVKANRTAIAINYQHLFPDRYHSTGVAV